MPGETGENRSPSDRNNPAGKQAPDRDSREKAKRRRALASGTRPSEEPAKRHEDGGRQPGSLHHPPAPRIPFSHGLPWLVGLFKWILYAVLAALIAYAVWKNRAELLAALRNLQQSLTNLWNKLFRGKARETEKAAAEEAAKRKRLKRFTDFADRSPGTAGRYRPEELVRYTFEALEAWAHDNGYPRLLDRTPHRIRPMSWRRGLAAGRRRPAPGRSVLPGGLRPRHAASG